MTEIWVPYGLVEVSFDIRQENLSQVLEPAPAKIAPEELEITADKIVEDSVVVLSGSLGVQKFLDVLLTRNKGVKKIVYPKSLGALCRRKAQEFALAAEQLQLEDRSTPDETPSEEIKQVMPSIGSEKTVLLSSVH